MNKKASSCNLITLTQRYFEKIEQKYKYLFASRCASKSNQILGDVDVLSLVGAADVVDQSDSSLKQNDLEGASNVFYEQKVSLVVSGSVESHFTTSHQLKISDNIFGSITYSVE